MSIAEKQRRHLRIRKHLIGTTERPRLSVFRSNIHIYAQIIDDTKSKTLVSESDIKLDKKTARCDRAYEVGKKLAAKAKALGIVKVVFDRGGSLYHGRIEKLALGAREGGLEF